MQATKQNFEIVKEIIDVLHRGNYTVGEAHSILGFVGRRIESTSRVEEDTKLIASLED